MVDYFVNTEFVTAFIPPWVAAALTPALAISGMAVIGCINPPAGAGQTLQTVVSVQFSREIPNKPSDTPPEAVKNIAMPCIFLTTFTHSIIPYTLHPCICACSVADIRYWRRQGQGVRVAVAFRTESDWMRGDDRRCSFVE